MLNMRQVNTRLIYFQFSSRSLNNLDYYSVAPSVSYYLSEIMSAKESTTGARFKQSEGDWTCSDASCGNVNFARRSECNKCGASKNTTSIIKKDGTLVKKGGHEIGKQMAEKSKGLFSADDWQCKSCGNVNWARRMTCNVCNAPKYGKVEQRTGYGGGFMERDEVVEYKERINNDDDDDDYDEFGRLKKGRRGKLPIVPSVKEKSPVPDDDEEEEEDEDGDVSKYQLESDDDEDADLSKYALSDESGSENGSKSKTEGKKYSTTKKSSHSSRSRSRSVSSSSSSSRSSSSRRRRRSYSGSRSRSRDRNHKRRRSSSYSKSRSRSRSRSPKRRLSGSNRSRFDIG